jgi:superfamily II DNA or RNA helicase
MNLRDHPFRIYYGPADDPLANFYIPALSASVRYDRSAGFFSSSALAVAAAGVARLIQNGGHMRLLVGASLDEGDVEAIRKGHDLQERVTTRLLERFPDPTDALLRQRLEVLAWMVAEGALEIRVVSPRDAHGVPLPASQTQDYYHPKSGIFTDANGDRVAFTGSVNESATAWTKNFEEFAVYLSWGEGQTYLPQVALRFERLWMGGDPGWVALPIPDAVRDRLLTFRPPHAPERDPLERQPPPPVTKEIGPRYFGGSSQAERALFQFLRDAPYLPGAAGLGAATAAITPWPHQTRVANELLADFPGRAMLCDEVGLGKTIEAGLVIRQLLISGQVKRCLILAPKSVLNQWQEELDEKFALEIPRYEDGKLLDVHDQPLPLAASFDFAPQKTLRSAQDAGEAQAVGGANIWDACDVLLASSQLAKRGDRRKEVLAARPWDLLVVDEAHHARRKDFLQPAYRPNRLLSLLNDLKERNKYAGLLLLTATPMQINPLEVWDLLTVLGMGGRWGADEGAFLRFFGEMRKPFGQTDWDFVFDMVDDYLAAGGELDPVFREQVAADIGPVKWATLEELPRRHGERGALLKQLGPAARPHVREMAQRHTPLSRAIYRNTRDLLRKYREKGILKESVPTRRPEIKRVPMLPDEEKLYNRIEEYITQFYQKCENERRGLGFVMTVYRRRLTSSFWAIHCSLERRLKFLNGVAGVDTLLTDEDTEQEELDLDIFEEVTETSDGAPGPEPVEGPRSQTKRFAAELAYVQDFIQELKQLSVADSKLEVLLAELNQVFKQRQTVLIFTQYTDTMDYLREQLRHVYGSQVACYSGRGGEVWNGIAWVQTTKEAVKADFRAGKLRILIGTESASEGLNLQTCGVLINYDMPWNPMRVEQRIGRIDRIGQEYPVVWISNYFYKDTIEDQIYQRLADRIDWFEVVVGDLQPILAQVGEVTRRLAMLPASEREVQLEKEIAALRERLQSREVESLDLDAYLHVEDYQPGPTPPVTLTQMEDLLTHAQATGHLFGPHPKIAGAYLLNWQGYQLPVTFAPACFDAHPDSVRFLSYGSPLLDEILASLPEPEAGSVQGAGFARCTASGEFDLRAWYARPEPGASPAPIASFSALVDRLNTSARPSAAGDTLASESAEAFALEVAQAQERHADIIHKRRVAHALTVLAKAHFLLLRAALVELALGQNPNWFDGDVYPLEFNEQAVLGLQHRGFPWGALLKLAFTSGLAPSAEDPYFKQIAGEKREALLGRFAQLKATAKEMVPALQSALTAAKSPTTSAWSHK